MSDLKKDQMASGVPRSGGGGGNLRKSNYAWLILVSAIGFYALPVGVIGNTSGIFLQPVMNDFGWSRTTASLYLTIAPWVAAVCTPFAGSILAKVNSRWVLTATSLIYGLATAATAYATQAWEWDLYGVIYGVTSAFFMYLAAPVLINLWFKSNPGTVLGFAGAALSITAAIASPVGQSLITSHGWQYSRMVLGLFVAVVSTVITALFVRRSPESIGVRPLGEETVAPAPTQNGTQNGTENGTAPAEEGATVRQARSSVALYMMILVAGIFCLGASFFQQIPSFAADGSLGAEAGAVAVSIVMVGGLIGKFLLGWMTDHVGSAITGVFASACGVVGILLAFIAGSNVALFYVGVALFGIAFAALTVVSPMFARQGFGSANFSGIYSWVSTGLFVFSGIAPLLYARVYDATHSFTVDFLFVIIIYVVAVAMCPVIVRLARKSWIHSKA